MPDEVSPARALAEEILADAARKAKRIQTRAEAEAKEIIGRARQDAERTVNDAVAHANARAQHEAGRILATVTSETRSLDLAAREQALDKVFAAAHEKLAAMPTNAELLAELCVKAVDAMAGDRFLVALSKRDQASASAVCRMACEKLAQRGRKVELRPDETPADNIGGAVVRRADGRMLFDNSFDARLARARSELRSQVAQILFTT